MKRYLDIEALKKTDLPPGREIVQEGFERGKRIEIGRSAFMRKYDVSSEKEYKERMIRENKIMFHAHIGLNSWEATAKALKYIYEESEQKGIRIDRFGLCLDRAMGLPRDYRDHFPRETGPRLETPEQWQELGQVVPIQPHTGDFMIGFPNSVENCEFALMAGVTTIGNLSQFFSMEIPGWTDDVMTTVETVKAISILASLKQKGALFHSYLDDGYGALFNDYATIVGWSMIEKYIIEELIGAELTICFGGMTRNPRMRLCWIMILKEVLGESAVGSMFYGDTISYTNDLNFNLGVVAQYVLWDVLAQLVCPSGHAIAPIPVTEAIRIPNADEILQVHILGRRMEEAAREIFPNMTFSDEVERKNTLVAKGKQVFQKALSGLAGMGVDVKDPVRLLYTLKKLGPHQFESFFGVGEEDERYHHNRKPVALVDCYESLQEKVLSLERTIREQTARFANLRGKNVLVASTDVHEHALFLLEKTLGFVGLNVFNAGAEKNPDQIADALIECGAQILAISTHNGMALEYAKLLYAELSKRNLRVPVFMGGRLNQGVAGEDLPRDVSGQIEELGIIPCDSIDKFLYEAGRMFV
jgi:methylmalonyl-CoA mutase cobalamin-binding subunit